MRFEKIQGECPMCDILSYVEQKCFTIKNGTYEIEIKRVTKKRTIDQNALMWMWFTCISNETGNTPQDVHDVYCAMFLPKIVQVGGNIVRVAGETKKLTTEQFTEFLDKVQADAHAELGIRLPNPEDRFFEEFAQQYT